jgi:hypothetical protein
MKFTAKRVFLKQRTAQALLPSQVARAYNFLAGADVSKCTGDRLERGRQGGYRCCFPAWRRAGDTVRRRAAGTGQDVSHHREELNIIYSQHPFTEFRFQPLNGWKDQSTTFVSALVSGLVSRLNSRLDSGVDSGFDWDSGLPRAVQPSGFAPGSNSGLPVCSLVWILSGFLRRLSSHISFIFFETCSSDSRLPYASFTIFERVSPFLTWYSLG